MKSGSRGAFIKKQNQVFKNGWYAPVFHVFLLSCLMERRRGGVEVFWGTQVWREINEIRAPANFVASQDG